MEFNRLNKEIAVLRKVELLGLVLVLGSRGWE